MLLLAFGKRHHQGRGRPRRPQHEGTSDAEPDHTRLRQEERRRRQDHQRQHAVPDDARTRVQVQLAVTPGEHVEHHVEEHRGDHDPPEDHTELDLAGEQLEQAEREVEDDRAGQIGVRVDGRVHAEGVEDRSGLPPDLFGVDAELVEEGLLVVEVGGAGGAAAAAAAADGAAVDGGGGGGGGGADVEGHEGEARARGARGLERRRGDAALLEVPGGGVSAGGEDHRRDVELLRHGKERGETRRDETREGLADSGEDLGFREQESKEATRDWSGEIGGEKRERICEEEREEIGRAHV